MQRIPNVSWRPGACALVVVPIAIGVALIGGGRNAVQAQEVDEHRVKAAFIVNFTRFVEWQHTGPIVIAVVGEDPIGEALVRSTEGQSLAGRPIVTRKTASAGIPTDVNVVFITHAARAAVSGIVRDVEGRGVLTVGDTAGFGQAGVALNLYVSEARVRFEANTAAATRAGVCISSQLLRLARIVG